MIGPEEFFRPFFPQAVATIVLILLATVLIGWGSAAVYDAYNRNRSIRWRSPQWEYRIGFMLISCGVAFARGGYDIARLDVPMSWIDMIIWPVALLATASAAKLWLQRRFSRTGPQGSGPMVEHPNGGYHYDAGGEA